MFAGSFTPREPKTDTPWLLSMQMDRVTRCLIEPGVGGNLISVALYYTVNCQKLQNHVLSVLSRGNQFHLCFMPHSLPPHTRSYFFPASLVSPSPAPRLLPLHLISPTSLPLTLGRFREGSFQHRPVCDRGSHGRGPSSQSRALRAQGKRLLLCGFT